MKQHASNVESILERLKVLEQRAARWRRIAFASAAVVVCGFLVAFAPPGNGKDDAPTVKTRKLVLVGPNGESRCILEVEKSGEVVQTFFDGNGKQRIQFNIDSQQIARFKLFDEQNHYRVGAATFPADFKLAPSRASFAVFGAENNGNDSSHGGIFLASSKNGKIEQAIYDKSGKSRVWVGTNPETKFTGLTLGGKNDKQKSSAVLGVYDQNGLAYQELRGSDGKRSYLLTAGGGNNDRTSQYFVDSNGKTRMVTRLTEKGTASNTFVDPEGKSRMRLVTTQKGDTHHLLFDGNGKERLSLNILQNGVATNRLSDKSGKARVVGYSLADGDSGQLFLGKNGAVVASHDAKPNKVQTFKPAGRGTKAQQQALEKRISALSDEIAGAQAALVIAKGVYDNSERGSFAEFAAQLAYIAAQRKLSDLQTQRNRARHELRNLRR